MNNEILFTFLYVAAIIYVRRTIPSISFRNVVVLVVVNDFNVVVVIVVTFHRFRGCVYSTLTRR